MPEVFGSSLQKYLSLARLRPDDPEAHFGLAMAYDEMNNFTEAFKEYEAVIRLNPHHAKAMLHIGFGYAHNMDYPKAILHWRNALKLNPGLLRLLKEPNNFYRKRIEQGISIFERAVTLAPDDSYTHYHLATAYRLFGRNEIALQEYQKTIDHNPNLAEAYEEAGQILSLMQQNQLAIKYLQKALQLNPNISTFHYHLGLIYEKENMLGNALTSLQKAIELDPKDSRFYFAEGNLLMKQGKYNLAIKAYQNALDIDERNVLAHYNLAKACEAIYRPEFAIQEYEKTIMLSPEMTEAYFNLGEVYVQTGNLGKAIPLFEEVLKRNPGDAYAHYNLGTIYQRLNNLDKALNHLNISVALNPKDAFTHYNLAQIYDGTGKLELALEEYGAALEIKPDDQHYHLAIAKDYRLLHNYPKEIEHLNKLLALDPDSQEILIMLAQALINNHQMDKALEKTEKLKHLNDQSADAHYYAGLALREMGETDAALAEFKQAIFIDPKHYQSLGGIAIIYRQNEQNETAIDYLKQAVAVKPDFVSGHFDLFNIYMELAFLEQAEREMAEILKYEPDKAEYLQPYTRVLYTRGKLDEASEYLQKLISFHDSSENRLLLGKIFQEQGKTDIAMAQFQKARQMDPQNQEISLAIAELYHKLGRYKKAIEEYRLVLQNHPDNDEAKNALNEIEYLKDTLPEEERKEESTVEKIFTDAVMLYIKTRFKDALVLLEQALELEPDYYPALYYQGIIAKLEKDLTRTAEIFEKGLKLAQTAEDHQYQLMFNSELTGLRKEMKEQFPEAPAALVTLSNVPEYATPKPLDLPVKPGLMENLDEIPEEAVLEALDMAQAVDEARPEAEIIKAEEIATIAAEILTQTEASPHTPEETEISDQLTEEISSLPHEIEIPPLPVLETALTAIPEPEKHEDLLTQAREFFTQEKYDRAKARLKELLKSEADNPEALKLMAEISFQQSDHRNALKYWAKLLKLTGDQTLHYQLGQAAESLDDYQEALAHYEKLLETEIDNIELKIKIAGLYHKIQEYAKAMKLYQDLVESHKDDIGLKLKLAAALEALDKKSLAVIQYQKALTLKPGDPEILELLGSAYLRLGKGEWAQKAFNQILEKNSNHLNSHLGILEAFKIMEEPDQALAHYREAGDKSGFTKEARDKLTQKYTELFGPLQVEEAPEQGKKPARRKAQKAKGGKSGPAKTTKKKE